ncbi:MAG: hypothetical protein VKS61_06805 [Candidatus Sericytochromatia bacterium]|nr:hypothetical protein [Candidatus Sericytochromatia bacterium]
MSDAASIPPLEARGTPAVVGAKVAHHFGLHRQARAAAAHKARRFGWGLVAAGPGGVALAAALALLTEFEAWPVPAILGVVALVAGAAVIADANHRQRTEPEARPSTQRLLAQLLEDFAPKTKLHLQLDARSASVATEAERTATSPYSGREKRYHRHEWLTLKGWLADGHLLGLAFTQLQKVKSGATMRDQLQVRGRLRLAGDREAPKLPGNLQRLHVQCVPGRPEVLFWGELGVEDDVLSDLGRLLEALRQARQA